MELWQLQERQAKWMKHNFPSAEPWEALVGALEELGELAHAHLKGFNGIRGLSSPEAIQAKKRDAVGDAIIYLTSYCNTNELDLQEAVEAAWAEVEERDWIRFPGNGVTE